jgi:DNA-binding MarR family transcriptional regulator
MPLSTFVLADSIVQRLSTASVAVRDYRTSLYRDRYGLRVSEWQILACIHAYGPMVQKQLCLRNLMDKVTVSRAVIKVVRRGLLNRVNHNWDRRSQYLILTAYGEELCARLLRDATDLERGLLAGLSVDERSVFTQYLHKIVRNAGCIEYGCPQLANQVDNLLQAPSRLVESANLLS